MTATVFVTAAENHEVLEQDGASGAILRWYSSSGTLSKRGYLPYGVSASTAGSFAYTAQRIDPETNGLYYYRARMYRPTWGLFMQSDPVGYSVGNHLQAYVGNDPLNRGDLDGVGTRQPTGDRAAASMNRAVSTSAFARMSFAAASADAAPLRVHAGHVIARLANGAQRATQLLLQSH